MKYKIISEKIVNGMNGCLHLEYRVKIKKWGMWFNLYKFGDKLAQRSGEKEFDTRWLALDKAEAELERFTKLYYQHKYGKLSKYNIIRAGILKDEQFISTL